MLPDSLGLASGGVMFSAEGMSLFSEGVAFVPIRGVFLARDGMLAPLGEA